MRRPRAVRKQGQRERTAREDGDLAGAELERPEEEVDVEAELVPGRSWSGSRRRSTWTGGAELVRPEDEVDVGRGRDRGGAPPGRNGAWGLDRSRG